MIGWQLVWAVVLLGACALVHGIGIVGITKAFRLEEQRLRDLRPGISAFLLLTGLAVCLFVLHVAEIAIFAAFYMAVGAISNFEGALFHSASAYSTLGHPTEAFSGRWRLVSALEGVVGFLLLGWSTAVFVTDINKALRQ